MKCEEHVNTLVSYYCVSGDLKRQYDYLILVSDIRHIPKINTPKKVH